MLTMVDENKRRFIKLLGGGIVGFSVPMSIYEGLIIPELQRRFIKELEYWMNEYKLADDKLKELQSKYETSNNTLTNLKQFENELANQIKLYSQMKEEAINKIKETINKYEILFGKEASFEKNAVKILEDLKIKGDKLLKSYKYLPAIVNLHWKPIKVINDKIYDINVSFEVISPLNSLKEVEVMLIPVEYGYFITNYGMREEDYDKVFPKEEIKTIKLQPKGLEGEMFDVTFADLKGGREYLIKAVAKDVSDSIHSEEIKLGYIREFENLGRLLYDNGIIVSATYMPWNFKDVPLGIDKPLLGIYDASDDIVQWKHVDWATGHGINAFFIDGGFWEKWKLEGKEGAIINGFMNKGIKCAIMWGWVWEKYFKRGSNDAKLAPWVVDLNDNYNLEVFKNLMKSLLDNKIFLHPNYLRIEGRAVLFIYDEIALINEKNAYSYLFDEFKKTINQTPFLIADTLFRIPAKPYNEYESYHYQFKDFQYKDGLTSWIGFYNPVPFYREYMENYDELLPTYLETWSNFTKEKGKYFIPSILPSFIVSGEANRLSRDIKKFETRLGNCIKFLDKRKPILMVDTWNDWLETTSVEPSRGEQFTYLTILKSQLKQLIWVIKQYSS
jgi:hypothetical protein